MNDSPNPSQTSSQPYSKMVSALARYAREAKSYPNGGYAPCPAVELPREAPTALIFSPHPDDECIVGGLALRLLRECGVRVKNVAVTQGSNPARQSARLAELKEACRYMGFDLIPTGEKGLENINPKGRMNQPEQWRRSVEVISKILIQEKPDYVFLPHDADWNSTHIGTHLLVTDAMANLGEDYRCYTIETEYWGAMKDPNLMVESSERDVADMVTGTSFHVGEVTRNPFHILLPAWMLDNMRRGSELVGGQGEAAPDFIFSTLYRLRRWDGSRGFQSVWEGGRCLSKKESPLSLFPIQSVPAP